MDPRIKGIELKLKNVKRIIPVVSGKGGVGKSMISTLIALNMAQRGDKVGLLDLDFHGASDHIILGYSPVTLPEEERGVIPPLVYGIKFMSIVFYTENKAIPLRGSEISDALIEILTITRWDELDYLIIDMPPGLSEQFLDLLRFLKRGEYLVITTPSPLSQNVAAKVIDILKEGKYPMLGIVENMVEDSSSSFPIPVVARIPYIRNLDAMLGSVERLKKSELMTHIDNLVKAIKERRG